MINIENNSFFRTGGNAVAHRTHELIRQTITPVNLVRQSVTLRTLGEDVTLVRGVADRSNRLRRLSASEFWKQHYKHVHHNARSFRQWCEDRDMLRWYAENDPTNPDFTFLK